jgi:Matrixin
MSVWGSGWSKPVLVAVSTVLLAIATCMVAPAAEAYTVTGCKWPNSSGRQTIPTHYLYGSTSPYYSIAGSVRTDWNNSQTSITLSEVSSGYKVAIYETDLGSGAGAGLTTWVCSSGYFSGTVYSRWNQYATDAYSVNAKKWVMSHELGHALGLGHSGSLCGSAAVMYPAVAAFYQCGWYSAKRDDTDGISNLYYP